MTDEDAVLVGDRYAAEIGDVAAGIVDVLRGP